MDLPQCLRSDKALSAALMILLLAAAGARAVPEENPPDPAIQDRLDVLARAREGHLQCFQPDHVRRTCKVMAGYSFGDDGQIVNRAQLLMDESGPAVVVVTSPVVVRNGAVCGQLDGLADARFLVAGQPATPSQEAGYRLLLSVAPRKGEVCARWVGLGNGGYWATGTLDGRDQKDFAQPMAWVEPGEGYVVAP